MMENTLYQAFDLQRFAPSKRLQSVIDASHARTSARELCDDELDMVAGGIKQGPSNLKKPEDKHRK